MIEYVPEVYWYNRFKLFRDNIRGAGNLTLSEENNLLQYKAAESTIKDILSKDRVINEPDCDDYQFLEIGVGSGYWTEFLKQNGVVDYTGIDITDILFDRHKRQYYMYEFIKQDVTKEPIQGKYDIIICLDVTQHIIDNNLFEIAMNNIKQALKPGGMLLITSWLSDEFERVNWYEAKRPLSQYVDIFGKINNIMQYRDKYLLQIIN